MDFFRIGFSETDDMHGILPIGDNGDVQPALQPREDPYAPLSIILSRVLGRSCRLQSRSATSSKFKPRSAMFRAFLAGSKVTRTEFLLQRK
jgi:hypothetical protein